METKKTEKEECKDLMQKIASIAGIINRSKNKTSLKKNNYKINSPYFPSNRAFFAKFKPVKKNLTLVNSSFNANKVTKTQEKSKIVAENIKSIEQNPSKLFSRSLYLLRGKNKLVRSSSTGT